MPVAPSLSPGTDDKPFGPVVGRRSVVFRVPAEPGLDKVRLELDFPPGGIDFELDGNIWALELPRPAVDRMEYQLSYWRDGQASWSHDPTNPGSVSNPFGAKSEVVFPDYRPPAWLTTPRTGALTRIDTAAGPLERPVPVSLWAADGLEPGVPAPLLIAHDGTDMAERGHLLRWAGQLTRPIRVALLDPPHGLRDVWYAANPDYSDQLAAEVFPALAAAGAAGPRIGLGASLGGLSMLVTARRHPGLLQALALQSGSFFTPELDPQESHYRLFDQICAAVADIATSTVEPDRAEELPRVLISCGAVEENRANNEAMALALAGQGYPVELRIFRDAHTMTGWRDAWSPGLDELITLLDAAGRTRP